MSDWRAEFTDEELAAHDKEYQSWLQKQQQEQEGKGEAEQLETEQVEVAHAELEAGLSALEGARGAPLGGRGPAQDAAVAHFLASLATSVLEIRDAIRGMAPGLDAAIDAQRALIAAQTAAEERRAYPVSEEPYPAHRSED